MCNNAQLHCRKGKGSARACPGGRTVNVAVHHYLDHWCDVTIGVEKVHPNDLCGKEKTAQSHR